MAAMLDFTTKERLSLLLKERKTENWKLIWLSQRTKKTFLFFFFIWTNCQKQMHPNACLSRWSTPDRVYDVWQRVETYTHTHSWWWSDREEDLQVCNSLTHTHTPDLEHDTLYLFMSQGVICAAWTLQTDQVCPGDMRTLFLPDDWMTVCVCVFCYQTCETALSINTHKHILVFVSLWGHRCDGADSYLLQPQL